MESDAQGHEEDKGQDDDRSDENQSSHLTQILLRTLPHMSQDSSEGRYAVGWKLHNERCLILAEEEFAEQSCGDYSHHNAQHIYAKEHQSCVRGEECAYQQQIDRESSTARYEWVYQYGYQSAGVTLDGACRHNSRYVTTKTHNHRDE